jgi:DNA-binding GntR family transcriptional regulator
VVLAAGSEALLRMWKTLEPFARTYVTAMVPGIDLIWLGERHRAIVEALEAGDPDLSASVLKEHSREARDLLVDHEEMRGSFHPAAAKAQSE